MRSSEMPYRDSSMIRITHRDFDHLLYLLQENKDIWSWRAVAFLERELIRASIIGHRDVPGNIVTMRSRVAFRVDNNEIEQVATLAYPGDRHACADALSVLTPIGAALLGLTEGQSLTYPAPDGRPTTVTVLEIIAQPAGVRAIPEERALVGQRT